MLQGQRSRLEAAGKGGWESMVTLLVPGFMVIQWAQSAALTDADA